MEISCDGNVIYTCSRNNEVCKIDLSSFQTSIISRGPNPSCTSMVILPAGEAILSGITTDNVFIYWELSSWREIRYKAGTYHTVYSRSYRKRYVMRKSILLVDRPTLVSQYLMGKIICSIIVV